jgi:hypothetical protein
MERLQLMLTVTLISVLLLGLHYTVTMNEASARRLVIQNNGNRLQRFKTLSWIESIDQAPCVPKIWNDYNGTVELGSKVRVVIQEPAECQIHLIEDRTYEIEANSNLNDSISTIQAFSMQSDGTNGTIETFVEAVNLGDQVVTIFKTFKQTRTQMISFTWSIIKPNANDHE